MAIDRIQRVNESIRRELSSALYHVGQGEGIDTVGITFANVGVSRDLRSAVVEVSFMGTPEAQIEMMSWLRRHRVDFQAHIARTVQLKYTPKLMFRQTSAVEKGNRVLEILSSLSTEEPAPPAPED